MIASANSYFPYITHIHSASFTSLFSAGPPGVITYRMKENIQSQQLASLIVKHHDLTIIIFMLFKQNSVITYCFEKIEHYFSETFITGFHLNVI